MWRMTERHDMTGRHVTQGMEDHMDRRMHRDRHGDGPDGANGLRLAAMEKLINNKVEQAFDREVSVMQTDVGAIADGREPRKGADDAGMPERLAVLVGADEYLFWWMAVLPAGDPERDDDDDAMAVMMDTDPVRRRDTIRGVMRHCDPARLRRLRDLLARTLASVGPTEGVVDLLAAYALYAGDDRGARSWLSTHPDPYGRGPMAKAVADLLDERRATCDPTRTATEDPADGETWPAPGAYDDDRSAACVRCRDDGWPSAGTWGRLTDGELDDGDVLLFTDALAVAMADHIGDDKLRDVTQDDDGVSAVVSGVSQTNVIRVDDAGTGRLVTILKTSMSKGLHTSRLEVNRHCEASACNDRIKALLDREAPEGAR